MMTIGLTLVAFITLTDRPETVCWLSEEQKQLAVDRVKSECLSQSALLDKIDATKLKRCLAKAAAREEVAVLSQQKAQDLEWKHLGWRWKA